ncbi:MAG TPA: ethanolamine ammonia-lyase subunit EutC [Candidatus Sulfotelmatobacter sp.]|nr:ethanolamine ammonia-lyase subunit EutC [Candidatus Sulfotelmatobacter sp.]
MKDKDGTDLVSGELPEIVRKIRARTPARLLVGRAGAAYRTGTQLELREAHAAARDAVCDELRCEETFGGALVEKWKLFEVFTKAATKDEYLLRPELGRQFKEQARAELLRRCSVGNDLQIAIGDGLSVSAVAAQVPALLRLLEEGVRQRQWKMGQVFVIRHCRVGILNEIGELLRPRVAVLLIGERPGLATAESLSAYMAYEPGHSQTDAERNVISNIHARGLTTEQAAARVLNLAEQMMRVRTSGCRLKEGAAALGDE